MKAMEAKLMDEQEKALKYSERINIFPPAKQMRTILAQRWSYEEVENMKEQQNILEK